MAAVTQNGNALKYVICQTEDICITAVQNDGFALQHVNNKTVPICIAAINNNYGARIYLRDLY